MKVKHYGMDVDFELATEVPKVLEALATWLPRIREAMLDLDWKESMQSRCRQDIAAAEAEADAEAIPFAVVVVDKDLDPVYLEMLHKLPNVQVVFDYAEAAKAVTLLQVQQGVYAIDIRGDFSSPKYIVEWAARWASDSRLRA